MFIDRSLSPRQSIATYVDRVSSMAPFMKQGRLLALGALSIGLFATPAEPVLAAPSTSPQHDVLMVGQDHQILVTINGVGLRLFVDPSAPLFLTLNPSAAQKAKISRGSSFFANIGPNRIDGSMQKVAVKFAFLPSDVREQVVIFDRPFAQSSDGTINPSSIPVDTVQLKLDGPPGGSPKAIRFVPLGPLGIGFRGLVAQGDATIRFSTSNEASIATASMGADLASQFGGSLQGAALPRVIQLGVTRPVRRLSLAHPLILPFGALGQVDVRTSDFGSVAGIADADADPNEIVVNGGKDRSKRRSDLLVGRDILKNCSSAIIDNRQKSLTVSCRS